MGTLIGFADYIIPLRGLKDGDHHFDYSIDGSFFSAFEQDDINDGSIEASVALIKRTHTYELTFNIGGGLKVFCDRCLDEIEISIQTEVKLVLKQGERYEEVSDEIISITDNEMDFNLAPFILDYILLEIPIKNVHEEGECNEDMLDKLDEYTAHEEEGTDPRWDELKNLLDKN